MPTLGPTSPARERILAMGGAGSGKTKTWMTIAKKLEVLKSPGTFHVLDTDMAVERMISGETFAVLRDRTQFMIYVGSSVGKGKWVPDENRNEGIVDNPRMYIYEAYDWPEYVDFATQVKATVTNDDWVVTDLHNTAWGEVHDFYVDNVHKKDVVDFYIAARDKKGGALDGDKDWSIINRMYGEFIRPLARLRCHWFMCTGVKALTIDGNRADPKDIRVLFSAVGVKPEGQKHTPHVPHTIIYLKEFAPGQWTMQGVKDRERERNLTAVDLTDFVSQYLMPVAGWKIQ